MVIKTAQIQFCAKVMQMEFGKFCYLFSQSFIDSLNENSIESLRPVKQHFIWTKDTFLLNFCQKVKNS